MSDTGSSASTRAIGLWRRTSFAVGDGPEDRTTTVFWGQTSRRYIDVRVPVRRPRCEAGTLARLADRDVRALGQQQGFAGDLVCVGDRFTWHRDIDFQPPTGRPDTGLVRIEGDTLHEEGSAAAGSTYRETFRRIASGSRRRLALRSAAGEGHMSASAAPVRADLVLIDDHFLLARARPEALPAAPGLGSLLANARRDAPDRLPALLDCEQAPAPADPLGRTRHRFPDPQEEPFQTKGGQRIRRPRRVTSRRSRPDLGPAFCLDTAVGPFTEPRRSTAGFRHEPRMEHL